MIFAEKKQQQMIISYNRSIKVGSVKNLVPAGILLVDVLHGLYQHNYAITILFHGSRLFWWRYFDNLLQLVMLRKRKKKDLSLYFEFFYLSYIFPNFSTYFLYASRYDFLSPISIKPDSILNPFTILFCSRAFLTASSIPKTLDFGISFRKSCSIT